MIDLAMKRLIDQGYEFDVHLDNWISGIYNNLMEDLLGDLSLNEIKLLMIELVNKTDEWEFCPACAITAETLNRFELIMTKTNMIAVGCPNKNTHTLHSEVDGVPDLVMKVMLELIDNDTLPGSGCITITINDNYLVISEVTNGDD